MSASVLKALPGKLDIKRHSPSILYVYVLYFDTDNKCRNNATCHDLHLGYWCECLGPGYEGLLCEREKDECTDWKPCQNGGTCVDKFSGYR